RPGGAGGRPRATPGRRGAGGGGPARGTRRRRRRPRGRRRGAGRRDARRPPSIHPPVRDLLGVHLELAQTLLVQGAVPALLLEQALDPDQRRAHLVVAVVGLTLHARQALAAIDRAVGADGLGLAAARADGAARAEVAAVRPREAEAAGERQGGA